ncbi:MAG: cytochrome P450, partial [Verrucomicrobia bacterium]|nr:cytochrome P450 [Verrucomicrobiota bacterium]
GPNEFFPFGGGTRRCIGMSFAMFEMKMIIATLLELKISHAGPPAGVTLRAITMAPDSGVPVVIEG